MINNTDQPIRARAIRISALEHLFRVAPVEVDGIHWATRCIEHEIPHDAAFLGAYQVRDTLRPEVVLLYSHPSWREVVPGGSIEYVVPVYQQIGPLFPLVPIG